MTRLMLASTSLTQLTIYYTLAYRQERGGDLSCLVSRNTLGMIPTVVVVRLRVTGGGKSGSHPSRFYEHGGMDHLPLSVVLYSTYRKSRF